MTSVYLNLLERALILIRLACQAGDAQRAEAIADAVHTAPSAIRENQSWSQYVKLYLDPLIASYPDLSELVDIAEAGGEGQ